MDASLWEILGQVWAIRAIVASSMVGLMCGVLGCFIVLRNMSLVGDALAHAILPGVVVAFIIFGYSPMGFFSGAVVAGLLTAVGITWLQNKVKTKNDAAVGIVFTSMFSLGVILISRISRNDGVHLDLKDFLFGYALGVSDTDLLLTGLVTVYVLLSVAVFYRYLFASTFQSVVARTMGIKVQLLHYFLMLLLSFAVVASLQTVGVILVVAMLITPAATALLLSNRLPIVLTLAGLIGLLSAIIGMVVAVLLNTPPGPAMALVATSIYGLAVVFAPKKGMLAKWSYRRALKLRTVGEDVVKLTYRLPQKGQKPTQAALRKELELSQPKFQQILTNLKQRKLLTKTHKDEPLVLTPKGEKRARQLVRAHRLWETYLSREVGLAEDQIHADAERLEHLLSDDLLNTVDAQLDFPGHDPHGSPIPARDGLPGRVLSQVQIGDHLIVAADQPSSEALAFLWQSELPAKAQVKLVEIDGHSWTLAHNGRQLSIPAGLAPYLRVETAS
ncbi:MAG: iron chelate uptake ABC transporter family permease subunit [Bacteroidota bacterium]